MLKYLSVRLFSYSYYLFKTIFEATVMYFHFQNPGRLKLQKDKVIFRNIKTGKVDQYSPEDVETIKWLIRAKGYCLKLMLSNGTIHRYDGFRDAVSKFMHYELCRIGQQKTCLRQ